MQSLKGKSIHFIGIGGAGMSGLARIALADGISVSGSDSKDSTVLSALEAIGAKIYRSHKAEHITGADVVIYSTAISTKNPELSTALERSIPVLTRAKALALLMSGSSSIAVAGTHGKTTTSSMMTVALQACGEDPSFAIGGTLTTSGSNAHRGTGKFFVAEADESDGSFLHYDTAMALITNVDPDHLDHYGSLEAFEAEFGRFAQGAKEFVAISSDDAGAVRVTGLLKDKKVLSFGKAPGSFVRLVRIDASGAKVNFDLEVEGKKLSAELSVPGEHNAINAAGALAVLVGLGHDAEKALAGIAKFGGTERRFELHGEVRGVRVYDDFAHHPTEVAAALKAARAVVGEGRLITVFQPHLYSRTRIMKREFAEALESLSDEVIVMDIYAAREDPEPGVTGALVSNEFKNSAKVHYVEQWDDVPPVAAAIAKPGDFIITMGCGDVYRMCPQLLDAFRK